MGNENEKGVRVAVSLPFAGRETSRERVLTGRDRAQRWTWAWETMFTTSTRRFSAANGSFVFLSRDLP
jgi:hypothetical protein